MAKRLCHFLIGLPGAGKSTFAQVLIQLNPHSAWICPDRIREQLYGDALIQGPWAEIQTVLRHQVDQALRDQQAVIYDATNVKTQWRLDFLQAYTPARVQWLGWQLTTSVKDCIHRNRLRSRQVPLEVILSYAQVLKDQPPSTAEGFLQVLSVPLNRQGQVDIAKTQQMIATAQSMLRT